MKAYTSLEQSKKLAEILPLESADMWWNYYSVTTDFGTPQIIHLNTPWVGSFNWNNEPDNIPAWSLAALLSLFENPCLTECEGYWSIHVPSGDGVSNAVDFDNPVDACVELIIKLKELNLL